MVWDVVNYFVSVIIFLVYVDFGGMSIFDVLIDGFDIFSMQVWRCVKFFLFFLEIASALLIGNVGASFFHERPAEYQLFSLLVVVTRMSMARLSFLVVI